MPETVEYTLAPFQDEFINSDLNRVALIAAKGSGKTWSGARFLLSEVNRQPDEQHLMMLNTLGQARDIFYQDIEPLLIDLNWPYHFNEQYGNLKIFDTIVHVRSAERDSIKRIESISYASGWADEVSFYDPNSFNVFRSRIRKGDRKVRVTSMPDDPEHWLYESLEKAKFRLHELSLYDNPDEEFVKNYEEILKSIYDETSLRRYLSGERVSLAGLGLFYVKPEMKEPLKIDPDQDILLSWDFNVEYRAVSAWQEIGKNEKAQPIVGCVKSWQMKQETVYNDAVELAHQFQNHNGIIYLGGDASENKKSSQTTESIWMSVRRGFRETFEELEVDMEVRNKVPKANPPVKDTIQCVNWALGQGLVRFERNEKNVYASLQAAKSDKYGEIDKSVDQKPTGPKTHEADTARYALFHYYKKLYPGGKSNIWVV